jgi:hypothetical protein
MGETNNLLPFDWLQKIALWLVASMNVQGRQNEYYSLHIHPVRSAYFEWFLFVPLWRDSIRDTHIHRHH